MFNSKSLNCKTEKLAAILIIQFKLIEIYSCVRILIVPNTSACKNENCRHDEIWRLSTALLTTTYRFKYIYITKNQFGFIWRELVCVSYIPLNPMLDLMVGILPWLHFRVPASVSMFFLSVCFDFWLLTSKLSFKT